MTPELWVTVVGVFISVALLTGLTASVVLTRNAPERRRLRQVAAAGVAGGNTAVLQDLRLTEVVDPRLQSIAKTLPKSPKDMSRLRRRLATAGIHSFGAALVYSGAELLLPIVFGLVPFTLMSPSVLRWVVTAIVAMVGYTTPGLILGYLITKQKRRIENGLPDALDLMIVCVEA